MGCMIQVEQHLGMVRATARRLSQRLPPSVELDDLIQAGSLGLMRAAERYDDASPVPFEHYAHRRVLGSMRDSIRRGEWRAITAAPLDEASTRSTSDAEVDATHQERCSQVRYALDKLTPRQRQVLLMLVCQSLSPEFAAQALRVSPQRVLALRSAGLAQLRGMLEHLRPTT